MSTARALFFFCVFVASHASAQSEEVVPPPPTYGAPAATPDPSTAPPIYVPPAAPPPASAVYVPPAAPVYTPPAVPRERRVIDWGLVGGGIGLLAGGWLATFVSTIVWYSATTSCATSAFGFPTDCTHIGGPGGSGLLFSFIPVVGPWLMLTDSYLDTPGEMVFPVIAGLAQDAGLILLIVGLATMHTETVMVEARRAGDVRVSGGAAPSGLFGSLDVVF